MSKRASLTRRASAAQDYQQIAGTLGIKLNPYLCAALVESLEVGAGQTLLDLGGGTCGYVAYLSRELDALGLCLDKSIEMLCAGNGQVLRVCGDARHLPLEIATVHAAYMINLLQLIPDPQQLFQGLKQTMKPGGRLALPITTREQLHTRFINRFFPGLLEVEKSRYFTQTDLEKILRDAGFTVISSSPLYLGSFCVDEAYIRRLRSGVFSGLLLLDSDIREAGFRRLECWVRRTQSEGKCTVVQRTRTLLIAEARPPR